VSDVLARRGTIGDQLAAQQSLVRCLRQLLPPCRRALHDRIDSYLTLLDAQRSLYAAQQGLINTRLAKLSNLATFTGAGGGQ
jgi:multidrug efflux system outer membrane protein